MDGPPQGYPHHVIRVRVAYPVRTGPLHQAPIIAVMLGKDPHVMLCPMVNGAGAPLGITGSARMDPRQPFSALKHCDPLTGPHGTRP